MFGIRKRDFAWNIPQDDSNVAVQDRPKNTPILKGRVMERVPVLAPEYDASAAIEYNRIATELGIKARMPDMTGVAKFKSYLASSGITIFSLAEVVKYMDVKASKEGTGGGWCWSSITRTIHPESFGVMPARYGDYTPGSDYFDNLHIYSHAIPLHALEKVKKIKAEFNDPNNDVSFVVSDYAPAPQYVPDPFLMVVYDNPQLTEGVGRFVIDFWDEPNFGIEQMLKSDLLESDIPNK